jgi:hypothetical protein
MNQISIIKSAEISKCGKYRYQLSRIWDNDKSKIMFIMLNPSTADDTNDDPTIKRCINFTKEWNYGGLYVCNLFAFRATNPKDLLTLENPFGDENIEFIKQYTAEVEVIVCAWGNKKILKSILKNQNPFELLSFASLKLHYLELSKNGTTPKHPLYLKADLKPKRLVF